MKKINILILLTIAAVSCNVSSKKREELLLINTIDRFRPHASVVIPRNLLSVQKGDLLPIARLKSGELIPSQVDNIDNNADWEELVLSCNFQPTDSLLITIEWVTPEGYPNFPAPTIPSFKLPVSEYITQINLETDLPLHTLSPILYHFANQMIDSAGIMINDSVGDTFMRHFGNSGELLLTSSATHLGQFSLNTNNNITALFPPQDAIVIEIIADGAVRSIFQITNNTNGIVQRTILWHNLRTMEITTTLALPDQKLMVLLPHEMQLQHRTYENNLSAWWKSILVSENKLYELSLAFIAPTNDLIQIESTPSSFSWIAFNNHLTHSYTTYIYSLWVRSEGGFPAADFFEKSLGYETTFIANPIVVKSQ